jgi:pimeloyl-ACP methyl ester carboxylesterase
MSRLSRPAGVTVVLAIACSIAAAPAAQAKVRPGPAGDAFYTPPSPLPAGKHGDAIWARTLTGAAAVPGASATKLVLYRSQKGDGGTTAVSGVVSIPKGKAPKGGWPVISWAHGTTGIADQCAPSRVTGTGGVSAYTTYVYPLLTKWLKAGYAVVRTDYQGLGTPGDHEYINGKAEGASVLDMVRAARQVDPRLSKNIIISGHSQGGHAALFAAAQAPKYTPELKLKGTVAFAPASHLDEQIPLTRSLTNPNPGLTGLIALIAYGLHAAYPAQLDLATYLSDAGLALAQQASSKCLLDLATAAGTLPPSGFFKPNADLAPVAKLLDLNDPSHLKIKTPVLVEQGTADTTVIPLFTDTLVTELKDNGGNVTYKKLDGTDHAGATAAGAASASTWIKQRLR